MSETTSHKRAKAKAAGKRGSTEVAISGGRRLDAQSQQGQRATEVERSGAPKKLQDAAKRLRDSGASQKVLQVPQRDMASAANAMRNVGVKGSVKNMTGSKRRSV